MNIYFNIDYRTVFGEELFLNQIITDKDGNTEIKPHRMGTSDGEHWTCRLTRTADNITYYYSVKMDGRETRHEWLTVPHVQAFNHDIVNLYTFYDHWIDMPFDSYLYSSAFTECLNRKADVKLKRTMRSERILRLIVRAPQLRANQQLAVVGAAPELGAWNLAKAIPMTERTINEWFVDIDARPFMGKNMEFKFVAVSDDGQRDWETGLNRSVFVPEMKAGELISYQLDQSFYAYHNQKIAGTLVPVFSLRSKDSFGVGDFGDLKKMIDWAAKTGQRLLQVLPINDTTITHTWTDSYPYSCISVFALHPQYVDLTALPQIKDSGLKAQYERLRKELNALPQIDYERVNDAKTAYLRILFEQEGKAMMATKRYKDFFKACESWLVPYAQYCHLRDTYGSADFSKWPDHSVWDESERASLVNYRTKAYKDVVFYYFVQFILDSQMQSVHEHARKNRVVLKGDIPIGVNRYGCDVWMEPEYFNLNGQAGAPPDDFSVNGQNWGFPTYNWERMLQDNCKWWVRRFQNMSKYFDAYRIDHVLGFFRIWEIPIDSVHGLLGQFSPSLGMTREEIEAYGLRFQEQLFTRPFIANWTLDRIFKERAEEVKDKYLHWTSDGLYQLMPEYDTQRKIEAWYEKEEKKLKEENGADEEALIQLASLRDGLYALVSNVLFLHDRQDANKFHPRISAQLDFMYESLSDNDKYAFNRLYDDYFYRRNNHFWYREAMKKLPRLVQATRMLVCAEDLGMVPDCVQWVMNELRILSLELQSMPKDAGVRFGNLSHNPYRSVCTISSHDTPTLRMWWDEDEERAQDYYNTVLFHEGDAPHPMPASLAEEIVSSHLACPSMVCVIALQDWLAIDEHIRLEDANAERVNIPANPKHYWRYRMHLNIEDLIAADEFNAKICKLVSLHER